MGGHSVFAAACALALATARVACGQAVVAAAVAAANALVTELTASGPADGWLFPGIDSEEITQWSNLPVGADRPGTWGAKLGDMPDPQMALVEALLNSTLSPAGVTQVWDIIQADDVIAQQDPEGAEKFGWSSDNFFVAIFGTPSPTDPWAWQLNGHHLGLTVTFAAGYATLAPSFLGGNPANWGQGAGEVSLLEGEITKAAAFVSSLTEQQRTDAAADADGVQMGPGKDGQFPAEPQGVAGSALEPAARDALQALVLEWISALDSELVAEWSAAVADPTHLDQIFFSFAAAEDPLPQGTMFDFYYRISGPRIWIEFENHDDHIHAVLRDPENDYGALYQQPGGVTGVDSAIAGGPKPAGAPDVPPVAGPAVQASNEPGDITDLF